ncbi:MAG: hypothetical protein GWO38_29480 [Phycisphaerae bacterium]|nr:hypothetical protein [Phycisphaerae bacterium]NIP55438.1 hypothetical protein [Phycisphaerae bacterium]NIW99089.1 hypothetical protein [Phycisphaerae bacterium]NIX31647.1 hypothetical protein [Phycisphaerae bacterium]
MDLTCHNCEQVYPADRERCPYCGEPPLVVWYYDEGEIRRAITSMDARETAIIACGKEYNERSADTPKALKGLIDKIDFARPDESVWHQVVSHAHEDRKLLIEATLGALIVACVIVAILIWAGWAGWKLSGVIMFLGLIFSPVLLIIEATMKVLKFYPKEWDKWLE